MAMPNRKSVILVRDLFYGEVGFRLFGKVSFVLPYHLFFTLNIKVYVILHVNKIIIYMVYLLDLIIGSLFFKQI